MDDVMLRADCAQCEGLCCVALAFDRSCLFAFDKAAGEACANLSACGRCTIHGALSQRGFAGCRQYDCLGAGQGVTRMFAGRSWRDSPETAREIFDAFHTLHRAHELALLLREAGKLGLPADAETARRALLDELLPASGWTQRSLAEFARSGVATRVRAFLSGLRDVTAAKARYRQPST